MITSEDADNRTHLVPYPKITISSEFHSINESSTLAGIAT